MMRHNHTSPFEQIETKWHCVMPIFVARQWVRHRTAQINEYSARYSIVKDRFYRPPVVGVREQSSKNKQGGENIIGEVTALDFLDWLKKTEEQYGEYERFTELGVSRELARIGLPASVYTEWYWKIDLHNLFHFLKLRMDKHAQQEIQDYANPIFEMVREICPVAAQAFLDYKVNALTLSGPEVEAINDRLLVASENKREQGEFEAKLKRLRL
jgi:thymidylate synthase (FAD)